MRLVQHTCSRHTYGFPAEKDWKLSLQHTEPDLRTINSLHRVGTEGGTIKLVLAFNCRNRWQVLYIELRHYLIAEYKN